MITNSPAVALWMSDYDHVEVNMLPGTINHKSKETVGSAALTALQQLHCDLVLLGVSSIDPEHGITTPYLESAETKRVIIKAGAKVMSLITPEKFGRISTYRIAGCNELDVIVTEGTPGLRRRARRHGRGRAHRQAVATPFPETARWAKDDSPHPWPVAPKTRPTTHSSFSRTPKEHQ